MKFPFQSRSFPVKAVFLSSLLLVCAMLLFPSFWGPTNAAAQSTSKSALEITPVAENSGYIISQVNGERVCLEATPTELQQMRRIVEPTELRVIYAGGTAAKVAEEEQTGLRITLRATSQLDSFPEAKAAFIRAAQNWEAKILTPISIIVDVDFGTTFFGETYRDSTIIGQTMSQTLGISTSTGYSTFRTALLASASNPSETTLYNTLPTGQIPTDQGTLTAVSGASALLRALGLLNATANPDAEQNFGDPPRIGFNSAFPFDFDPNNGIASNQLDFDAVATHEIGHLLGFSSFVGQRELNPSSTLGVTVMDFFRFRPGVNLASFSTAQRILASGGTQVFFAGGAELGLSTGRPDGTGGDRNQASHWKADEITGTYIGIMDPTARNGQRDEITPSDLHAFDILGYRLRSTQQQLDVSTRTLDFGDTPLSASTERTLTVFNTGGQPLQITGISSNNARFSVISPGTSFTIPPNSQQNVILRFTPTANGAQTATLTLNSNDPNRPTLTVSLSGFGGVQPTVALTSGAAQNGTAPSAPASNSCQLDPTQYTIQVPVNATQLRLTLSGNQDLDLYARFGQRVTGVSPNWTADHISDSPNNNETITITPSTSPTLRAGTYFIGVTNCDTGAANYTLTATVTGGSAALAAVSAASFRSTELASDSIVSVFGQNLATANASATTTPLPTSLAGTTVRVRDSAGTERTAQLFFVSSGQINFVMPSGTAQGTATITVTSSNGATSAGTINIASVAPGVFAANSNGSGAAAALALRVRGNGAQSFETATRLDTSTNRFVTVPIDLGEASDQVFAVLFGTGIRNRSSLAAVTAQVGGTSAQIQSAGASGQAGVDQINVLLPRSLAGRGEVDVVLTVEGKVANTVRVNIK